MHRCPKFGDTSIYFNGTSDILTNDNIDLSDISLSDFTFECWFNIKDNTRNADNITDIYQPRIIADRNQSGFGFSIKIKNDKIRIDASLDKNGYSKLDTTPSWIQWEIQDFSITIDIWYHIAMCCV